MISTTLKLSSSSSISLSSAAAHPLAASSSSSSCNLSCENSLFAKSAATSASSSSNCSSLTVTSLPSFISSRVIIRNLPSYVVEEKALKEHIYEKAAENAKFLNDSNAVKYMNNFDITDCKIMKTKSFKSRRFAYVGFKNEKIAQSFIDLFNNTYFSMNKISVAFALPPNFPALPKPLSVRTRHKLKRREERMARKNRIKNVSEVVESYVQNSENSSLLKNVEIKVEKTEGGKAGISSIRKHITFINEEDGDNNNDERKEDIKGDRDAERSFGGKQEEKKKKKKTKKKKNGNKNNTEEKKKESPHQEEEEQEEEEEKDLEWIEKFKRRSKQNLNSEEDLTKNFENKLSKGSELNQGKNESLNEIKSEKSSSKEDLNDNDVAVSLGNRKKNCVEENDKNGEVAIKTKNPVAAKRSEEESMKKIYSKAEVKEIEEGRIMLTNLAYTCTEEEIHKLCKEYGEVSYVHLSKDESTKMSRGFAFVLYAFTEHAIIAVEKLNNSYFQGRIIQAKYAFYNRKSANNNNISGTSNNDFSRKEEGVCTSSYKRKKEKKLKADCAENERAWNLLYASANAYMNVISEDLNVDKYDIYNFNERNLAVKQTLAETHIINQTKEWLKRENINVNAFIFKGKSLISSQCAASLVDAESSQNDERNCEGKNTENMQENKAEKRAIARSDDTIIIKHLPSFPSCKDACEKEEEKLRRMFARYGEICKFLLSPSKTVAICRYLNPHSAMNAFKNLSYSNFRNSPLFLEIPYINVFLQHEEEEEEKQTEEQEKPLRNSSQRKALEDISEDLGDKIQHESLDIEKQKEKEEEEPEEGKPNQVSIFVKNLNFKTTDNALLSFFKNSTQGCTHALVMKKKVPVQLNTKKNDQEEINKKEILSMGYGFVTFSSYKYALEAIKKMQGAVLDGYSLELKVAKENKTEKSNLKNLKNIQIKKNEITKKILVKNLPFEASKHELFELFSAYGNVQAIRIPKKMDGQSRGYAFVEFLSKTDAVVAMEALQHSHFYGRHLVLEAAKDDEDTAKIELENTFCKIAKTKRPTDFQTAETDEKAKKRKL